MGNGLEIGALNAPSRVPASCSVLYSDILTPDQIDSMYPGSTHPDILSDSEHFPSIDSKTFDFVIANHVLEHLTDPVGGLAEWHRIFRSGGQLLMAVPDKRFTFDFRRPRTALSHHLDDHESELPAREMNFAHLKEWAELVEGLAPGSESYNRWLETQLQSDFSVHNHVWLLQDVVRLVLELDRLAICSFALVASSNSSILRNEFVLLLKAADRRLSAWQRLKLYIVLVSAWSWSPVLNGQALLKRFVRRCLA
jgi:SAM-dependent methyltransferase